jgi:glycosyltransferase involved in cell wall biosynthesis
MIGYWIFNYMPQWEAASKEVQLLHETQEGSILFALNTKQRKVKLKGPTRHIPLPWGLVAMPWLLTSARRFEINHIYASAGERLLLPRIGGRRTVLTVTKEAGSLARVERSLPHLKRLGMIVVESEQHYELFAQSGISAERLQLIYPSSGLRVYREALTPFRILFASSPPARFDLLSRGIHLMLSAARRLPEVRFVLAWRQTNLAELNQLIAEFGVTNVEVHNGCVDMDELYASCSACILPGLTHNSLKPCPHSALESLAHGKPVLVSRPTSISGLVERERCGLVFEPTVLGLEAAVVDLQTRYAEYQSNCHRVVEEHFAPDRFCSRYDEIYASLRQNDGA